MRVDVDGLRRNDSAKTGLILRPQDLTAGQTQVSIA